MNKQDGGSPPSGYEKNLRADYANRVLCTKLLRHLGRLIIEHNSAPIRLTRNASRSKDQPKSPFVIKLYQKSTGITQKKVNYPRLTIFPSLSRQPLTPLIVHPKFHRPPQSSVYTRQAIRYGQEGTVTIHTKILPDGTVQQLKLIHSSGHPLLDRAAIAAIRKGVFEPAVHNVLAVDAWVEAPVYFILKQSSRG